MEEAKAIVGGVRQDDYGHPFDDFTKIARMWEGYLNLAPGTIEPEDVALMMSMLKMSRLRNSPAHTDSQIDIHGYMLTYEMIRDFRNRTGKIHKRFEAPISPPTEETTHKNPSPGGPIVGNARR